MMTPFIVSFDTISSADLTKVGGKGSNLGKLAQAGFNVPPGFCISTNAFACFMAQAPDDIYTYLDEVSARDLDQLRCVGKRVRMLLENVPFPTEVADAVVQAWLDFGADHAYAVRSSATAEDLPHASFAGQQDTYLNVCGKEALLMSVKACFISLFTDRAILYRLQNGFDHRQVALSVIVQRMVQSNVAGILFTADPVTGNRNIASIDASFGLGEALVSGLVSADLYQVNKRTNDILKRQINPKQIAIRSLAGGGARKVELTKEESAQAALTDAQVLELARLGSQIEAHYKAPQDIEWALAGNSFYITQARPITSLYPLPEPQPADDALHVYVSASHFQVMTNAMPPLALSVLRTILPVGHTNGQIESNYILPAGGRAYADCSSILRHPVGRRLFLRGFKNADQLAVGALAEIAKRPNFASHGERINPLRLLPIAYPYILKIVRLLFWGQPEGATSRTLSFMDEYIATVKSKLDGANNVRARLAIVVSEMQNLIKPVLTWAPCLVAGVVASILLRALLDKREHADHLIALGRGLTGNVATEMNLAVGDLADAARASEALISHLRQADISAETQLSNAAHLPGGETFLQAWNTFISTYGMRGPSEIDLSRPRWSEDPSSLLHMVVGALGHSAPGTHRAHHQNLVDEGERAAKSLIAAARRGWGGWLRGPLTHRLICVSRNFMPLREHHKFLAIRLLALTKPVLREAGEQLQAEGRLDAPDDIWFLTLTEVFDALDRPATPLQKLVRERRSAFEHYQHLTPPRVMTSEGEIPVVKYEGAHAPVGALVGSPVSAGVVEGIAKVVLDPNTEMLDPGEILIAPFTDPGWTPLFVNAAGLVTEVGGLMTHGSVVAREYGIPAVVGVLDATKKIKTGQRIRVHGDAGYIELLEHKHTTPEVGSI
ncbi:MAG: phosphoenolpyruvate synthase [Chloroflexales bacterium]|nr:phosphoenolpyruvate synthase [Chloroflexales bacterium]